MGQKVNPIGLRLGYIKEAQSIWFPRSNENYAELIKNDNYIREYIFEKLPKAAAVSKILIERSGGNVKVIICSAKPGIVIGKKGEEVEKIRQFLSQKFNCSLQINIREIRKPELDAQLVADNIAAQLEKRIMFRRAMKRAVQTAMRQGAKGIKVAVAGRLGGAEIARTERYHEGRVPLHTLRADIDYAVARAKTTYGIIGVKVWIFKGEVFTQKSKENNLEAVSNRKSKPKPKQKPRNRKPVVEGAN